MINDHHPAPVDARRAKTRRTRHQLAADKLIDAVAVLVNGPVDPADRAAFESARAAVEKYRVKVN